MANHLSAAGWAILVATSFVATSAVTIAQTPVTPSTAPQQITVVGCVAKDGHVDINRGTRRLDTKPGGFALLEARMADAGASRPGSADIHSEHNSGTLPQRDVAAAEQATDAHALGFALMGKTDGLEPYINRRVAIVGILNDTTDAGAQHEASTPGTTGAAPGSAVPTGAESAEPTGTTATAGTLPTETGTRGELPATTAAHPSAELQPLTVLSFSPAATTEPCTSN